MFSQLLINGLQVGALYSLTASGFSLIYGATKIFHFAHGVTLTLAAYVFYYVFALQGGGLGVAILLSILAAGAFGVVINKLVYAPIQKHEGSFFTIFVGSLGFSIVVQNVIGVVFGRSIVNIATPMSKSFEIVDGVYISSLAIMSMCLAVLLFICLHVLMEKTTLGISMRALSENKELVKIFGLNQIRLSYLVFILGSILTVPAAIVTILSSGIDPFIGGHIMLVSLTATIIGGIGSLRGAALAGLMLGLIENLSLLFIETQWSEAVTFLLLVAFIIGRPEGIFGKMNEK